MRKTELLAPAGGPKQYIAAVENGADAVYLGGPEFNARIGAENFTEENLKKAVDYGHLRGVKTYVTMNTLLDEEDLGRALRYAGKLYSMGVDALIIQDLGLGLAIHQALPDMPLHLSTQATVYNRDGVIAAGKLGYSRVVLARELSLREIAECSRPEGENYPETEVFVHGAMCFCYSGQCQLSRFIGGRSGNRGTCAQPCRLPYKYIDEEGRKLREEYPLSPKDLWMIDNLGELIESGTASLKIEGRMKSPEYVATVVRIYRKYLDLYLEKGRYSVEPQDREELIQIFNRGGFTEGYAHEDPGKAFMSDRISKNQGVRMGEVTGSHKNGILADVKLDKELHMHDVIEVRGNGTSFSTAVTYLKPKGRDWTVGDMKDIAGKGDEVYRIVSSELMKKAGDSFLYTEFCDGKFFRKLPIDVTVCAFKGTAPKLSISVPGFGKKDANEKTGGEKDKSGILNVREDDFDSGCGACAMNDNNAGGPGCRICFGESFDGTVSFTLDDFTIEEAKKRATTADEIDAQLRKTGDTPFKIRKVRILADEDIFLPVSVINELRRKGLEALSAGIVNDGRRVLPGNLETYAEALDETAEFMCSSEKKETREGLKGDDREGFKRDDCEGFKGFKGFKGNITYEQIVEGDYVVLPQVARGDYDRWLGENYGRIAARIKDNGLETADGVSASEPSGSGIVVNNISQIMPLAECGICLIGGYGLNITNHMTAEAYKKLGMSEKYMSASELMEKADMDGIPLMVTEHRMIPGTLTDRKGQKYAVEYNENLHKSFIFPIL